MKIISVVNQKGGTGKTTTVISLGATLAKEGNKVLLIDLDPQGNLGYSLGINDVNYNIGDVLMDEASLGDAIINAEDEGLDVVASTIGLADTEIQLLQVDDREYQLKTKMDEIGDYDYVIIDCPPSLSLLTVNALAVSDEVIIPLQMTALSLQGLELITDTIAKVKDTLNSKIKIVGILPVMVDKRRKLSIEVKDYIEENFDIPLFNCSIRNNVRAAEAPSFGQSVIQYSPKSNSAVDYIEFGKEFLEIQ